MLNEPDFFWKNFRLGTELKISGTFLYNGLYAFDQIENFYYEEEIFEFLYQISVGLERLFKIAVILLEHDLNSDQEKYEKSLITHNHLELLKRIKKRCGDLKWDQQQIKFLQLTSDFYHSMRYNRFIKKSVYKPDQDNYRFIAYLEDQLKTEIKADMSMCTENEQRFKNFIGKIIGRISNDIYAIIREETFRLGIFTHEVSYKSKAFKIFISKEFTFENEIMMQKEVLVYLLNQTEENDAFQQFINNLPSLPFEMYHTHHYVSALLNIHKNSDVTDEMKSIYDNQEFDKERFEAVKVIGEDFDFEAPDNSFFDDFDLPNN